MMKKILLILAHSFYLFYLLGSFPFKLAYIVIKDKKDKSTKEKKLQINTDVNVLYIGELLFADCIKEFKEFCNLYLTDKKQLNTKFSVNLQVNNGDCKPINIVYAFGTYKQKIGLIDWKGEENINEVEEFIESYIDKKPIWENAIFLRASVEESKQYDGIFIKKLFHAIDKDLQSITYRLLFFDMGGDTYVYIPITTTIFKQILENAPNDFQSVDDL
jgi:hypothetical protein